MPGLVGQRIEQVEGLVQGARHGVVRLREDFEQPARAGVVVGEGADIDAVPREVR